MNNNEAGFSLVDALLGLFIWSTCALVFLPMYSDMRLELLQARQALHAAEVMEHAARMWGESGVTAGTHTIDDVAYTYTIALPTICVSYPVRSEAETRCKDFSNSSVASH